MNKYYYISQSSLNRKMKKISCLEFFIKNYWSKVGCNLFNNYVTLGLVFYIFQCKKKKSCYLFYFACPNIRWPLIEECTCV